MTDDSLPRRLVLVRHGRTAWNAESRAQGHSDVPLDDLGLLQAAALGPALAQLSPTVLWSSDLRRARQTADAISLAIGLRVESDARLREFDMGMRTGLTTSEYATAHPQAYVASLHGVYDATPGGERTTSVVSRMTAAINEALAAIGPGDTCIVVSHGGALKVALVAMLGLPPEAAGVLRGLDNCGWAEVQVTRGQGSGVGPGPESGLESGSETTRRRLMAYNRVADFASREGVG